MVEYDDALLKDAQRIIWEMAKERFPEAKLVRIKVKEDVIDDTHVLLADIYYDEDDTGLDVDETLDFKLDVGPRLAEIGVHAFPMVSFGLEGEPEAV